MTKKEREAGDLNRDSSLDHKKVSDLDEQRQHELKILISLYPKEAKRIKERICQLYEERHHDFILFNNLWHHHIDKTGSINLPKKK